MSARKLTFNIRGNLRGGSIVALRACNDRLGHGDNITVMERDVLAFCRRKDAFGNDLGNIVPASDNGCADTARNCTDESLIFQN